VVDLDPNCGDMKILPGAMIHHDRLCDDAIFAGTAFSVRRYRLVVSFFVSTPWLFVVIRLGYPCERAT
jgi:hypothetical protein